MAKAKTVSKSVKKAQKGSSFSAMSLGIILTALTFLSLSTLPYWLFRSCDVTGAPLVGAVIASPILGRELARRIRPDLFA